MIEALVLKRCAAAAIALAPSLAVALTALVIPALVIPARAEPDLWPELKREIFGAREVIENDGALSFFAPEAAEDAAIVPISIRFPSNVANEVRTVTLIVDRNPAPVAATFTLGDAFKAGPEIGERYLATRIRVDSFSKVRAVAETSDGRLHMVSRFVAGAGGCTAPASKDLDEALASLGRMKVQGTANPAHDAQWREATIMIRHPNFTGMQRDPKSGTTTPARFVRELEVRRGGALVLRMEGGISISEDPNFRFNYAAGDGALEGAAVDTDGAKFSGRADGTGS